MENEKALVRIRELSAQVQALTEQLAAAKAAAEEFQQEARALAEQLAALREQDCRSGDGSDSSKIQNPKSKIPDTPDLTHALIEDGQAYRERLRAEVQRLAGLVGSEAEASLLLSALPQAPAAQLQQLVDGYQARVEERFPPQPHGQPAALAAPDRKATPHQDPPSAGTRRRPVRLY